jgi:two-component system chemotaxis response regulator CheY
MQMNAKPTEIPSTTKTILVVDDYASVRFYHANLLRQAGYKCLDARDGFEALEKVRQARIDLILLDLIMPKMSGDEFIKRIRATREYASIPLLVVTSESVEDKIRQVAGSGPIGFAIKPLIPANLLESVRKLIA